MSISKVGTYAFYNHPNLERAVVSAPVIEANAFQGATKLETVDLTSTAADTINASAFSGCSKLTHLIVRSTARSSLSSTSALDSTKIKLGDGGIYVPADLLDSYKGATNWSVFAKNIYPIGEYPRENFDSISDSWSDIFANANYATDYTVKDTKTLELTDGTKIKMDLAALDTDVKSDNSGTAKMTWICHGIPYKHRMSATDTTAGGWADSEMRSWLISDIFSKIPTEIKSHIVSVKKSYKCYPSETLWSDDEIWIPSLREKFGSVSPSIFGVEDDGVTYTSYLGGTTSTSIAIKYYSGSPYDWWTRTVSGSQYYKYINNAGNVSDMSPSFSYGVVFGFCTD